MRAAAKPTAFDSVAHILSIVGSPPVLALPIAILIVIHQATSAARVQSTAELLVSACILPAVFTFALFRAGITSSLDLREQKDRLLPSTITTFCCALGWAVLRLSAAPQDITNLAIAVAAQMAILALLTTRWKVSYHTAAAAVLVLAGRSLDNTGLTLALGLIACSVGWARVHQGRHTINQVLIGALTTIPVGFVM